MVSKEQEERWRINKLREKEKKEQVINFIVLMMEEYDINTYDLE